MIKRALDFAHKKLDPIGHARRLGVTVGSNCRLIDVSFSSEPWLIRLGDHVSATRVRFETHDGGVWVLRGAHPALDIIKPITVGNNVFLGYGAIVLPGVTIGENVVVGAGAIVSRDVPPNCVAAGVPARVIKSISDYEVAALASGIPTKQMSSKEKRAYVMKK